MHTFTHSEIRKEGKKKKQKTKKFFQYQGTTTHVMLHSFSKFEKFRLNASILLWLAADACSQDRCSVNRLVHCVTEIFFLSFQFSSIVFFAIVNAISNGTVSLTDGSTSERSPRRHREGDIGMLLPKYKDNFEVIFSQKR